MSTKKFLLPPFHFKFQLLFIQSYSKIIVKIIQFRTLEKLRNSLVSIKIIPRTMARIIKLYKFCVSLMMLVVLVAILPFGQSSMDVASFRDLKCKGEYNSVNFSKLDRLCEDCYNLFRTNRLYTLCK